MQLTFNFTRPVTNQKGKYGIPYQGSKGSIVEALIQVFPQANHFYDLFGGGFSVTHAMLQHRAKEFKEFHYNELKPGTGDLIQRAINGEFNYKRFKPEFVTREMFIERKEVDAYTRIIWSFGNNQRTYLFGRHIERQKESLHNAVVFNRFDDFSESFLEINQFSESMGIKERRLFAHKKARERGLKELKQLQQLERLESLQRLQSLQSLEQTNKLHFHNQSYDDVLIKPNSIIYCDPPYNIPKEKHYGVNFDTPRFLNWAANQTQPVFISEYEIKDPRFEHVFEIEKRSLFSPDKSATLIKKERIYVNEAGAKIMSQRWF